MFLDEKTVLEISLNPWLNLTIFQGTWPWQVQPSPAGYKENDRLKAAAQWSPRLEVRRGANTPSQKTRTCYQNSANLPDK